MNYIHIQDKPDRQFEQLIMAFAGWPDAGESATAAIQYLMRRLDAVQFAAIDPEEFYDFTQERPRSSRTRDGRRRVRWPANEFSWWAAGDQGALFFVGIEPNLKWRTFSETIAGLARAMGVKTVIQVGALLDAVPHTREIRLTGSSTRPELQEALDSARIGTSNYQGPTGISTAVLETCTKQGMSYSSLWGHTPHYLHAAPNYRVSYTLARTLSHLLDLPANLGELRAAAESFDREVTQAVGQDDQLAEYVRKLEDRYDEATTDRGIPDPAEVVRELEQFLRAEQRRNPGPSN